MQNFEQLVDAAINFSKSWRAENREYLSKMAEQMNAAAFAREFCTIHLDVGRQVGKTTYIKNRQRSGDVIITPTFAECKRHFDGRYATYIKSASEINIEGGGAPTWLRGRTSAWGSASTIYVDEPELVLRSCPLHLIYSTFASGNINQTFVLLGH